MHKMEEPIIVVPRDVLFGEDDENAFQGGITCSREELSALLKQIENNYKIVRRGDAEEDESLKQIIPYVLLYRDVNGGEVFAYRRLQGGGEKRLHNRLSIGVGGHMNEPPQDARLAILTEAKRELEEEIDFGEKGISVEDIDPGFLGVLNDDSDAVGRVHFGIVIIVEVYPEKNLEVREVEQLDGSWLGLSEVEERTEELEGWSQISLQLLGEWIKETVASPST